MGVVRAEADLQAQAYRRDERCRRLFQRLWVLEPWILRQQIAVTEVAAPTGFEALRAEWMLRQWRALEIKATLDEAGNVIAVLPGADADAPWLALTAHLDTAFVPGTPVRVVRHPPRVSAPGIADNGAGLAALLALGHGLREESRASGLTLRSSGLTLRSSIALIANVGEEGEGNLRGMRHVFAPGGEWARRIGTTIVLDGPGCDSFTAQALPNRRLRLSFSGSGGHSWSDLGRASAVHAAARVAAALLAQMEPRAGELGCNIGCMQGGTTVNAIAAGASLKIDLRARTGADLDGLEGAVRRALAVGLEQENATALEGRVRGRIELLGERPEGRLANDSPLLSRLGAVDAVLGIVGRPQPASTDANLPLSQGREALRLGAGGSGGGAHTLGEWFDPTGRGLALERIALLTLCVAGLSPEAAAPAPPRRGRTPEAGLASGPTVGPAPSATRE